MTEQTWTAETYLGRSPVAPRWTALAWDISVAFAVFLALTFFAFGWYAPSFAKWLVIAALSSLCWIELAWAAKSNSLRIDLIDAVATVLFLWVLLSIRWSPDPMTGKDTALHWAMLLGIFFSLRRRTSTRQTVSIGIAAAAGMVVVVGFELADFGSFGGYYNQNLITEMMLAAMPLLFTISARFNETRFRWYTLALAVGIAVHMIFFNGSKIAFAVWSVLAVFFSVAALARISKRLAVKATLALMAVILLSVFFGWEEIPFAGKKGFRASFLPRIEYTINTLSVWKTHPVRGVGAGGFNSVFASHQDDHAEIMNVPKDQPKLNPLFETAGAAHNDILQFIANFGLVGLLIVGVGVFVARSHLANWRRSPSQTAGLVVLLTVLTNALLEFPLQMPATLLLFVIGLAWTLPINNNEKDNGKDSRTFKAVIEVRVALGLAAIIAVSTNSWWSWNFYPAQKSFAEVLSTIYIDPHKALAHNEAAINSYPYDDMFRRQYLITLMRWDETAKARVIGPEGYDKVFEVTNTVGPVTGTVILRLQYLLQSGRFIERAEEVRRLRDLLLAQSPRVPDVWLLEAVFEGQAKNIQRLRAALERYDVLTGKVPPANRVAVMASLRSDLGTLEAAEAAKGTVNK